MTTYKGIRGHTIRTIAGDASPLVVGDIWYSNTTKKIRAAKLGAGAWATGGSLNTGREYGAGAGTMTAALIATGSNATASFEEVETYDGSSWTEVADTNTSRGTASLGGAGTQTAAIIHGGYSGGALGLTETFDGSSWTEVGDFNTATDQHAGANAGTQTATLAFGGGTPAPHTAKNESWNGTSWTEVGDLTTSRERLSGAGTSTAALAIDGAQTPGLPYSIIRTESWDGSSWTEVADTTSVHYWGAAWGSQTSAVVFGSYPAQNYTDEWDGTAWAEAAAINTNRVVYNAGTGGPGATEGILMGGTPNSVVTEEWTKAVAAVSFTSS